MNDARKQHQNILGKTIALTKQIYLKQPSDESRRLHQFRGGHGKTKRAFGTSGIYLNWWFTDSSRRIIEEIVEMAVGLIPDLRGVTRGSLREVVVDTLKDNAFNRDLFLSDEMFLGSATTLFEARTNCDAQEFADRLWAEMAQELSASLSN